MRMVPLSVLDLSPVTSGSSGTQALRNSLDLAGLADRLGYTRYWLAEHHNLASIASAAPEIMISLLARRAPQPRLDRQRRSRDHDRADRGENPAAAGRI